MKKTLIKITKNNNLWKKGQKVWQVFGTGALASYVVGKYKGNGRWIKAWVHLEDENGDSFKEKPNARYIGEVEVNNKFYNYIDSLSG